MATAFTSVSSVDCTSAAAWSRVAICAVVTLLLSAGQAQAFLPTPDPQVMIDELVSEPQAMIDNHTTHAGAAEQTHSDGKPKVGHSSATKAQSLLASWRAQAKTKNLAQQITWRRLLYFLDDKKTLMGQKRPTSLIDEASFFLSDTGGQDPSAELDALLVALADELAPSLNTTNQMTANSSVRCRFPARVHWLVDRLNIDKTALTTQCPALDTWLQKMAPERLSILFAEEYVDNPLSAFAHTLLRIDSHKSAADPSQIYHAYALNDTVDGDPNDGFLIYAARSITGGYDNIIEIDPYPRKLAKYLKDDERDVWTYPLNLHPSEVQQIMWHVWETKDVTRPYYFTTDNCASEILRLIDVIRPQQSLLSQLPYAVIPSEVVQLLDDTGLLAPASYTPADDTVRQAALNQRQAEAQLGYQPLTNKPAHAHQSDKQALASSMSAEGQTIRNLPIIASDNNPIDRHPLSMAQMAIGVRGDHQYVDVGVRAGFHDSLDRATGFPAFFNLEGLGATLRFYDKADSGDQTSPNRVVLQDFTLLRGRSFNPVNTAQQGKTWGINLEATRINDGSQPDDSDHLVGSAGYETGWSWAFGTPSAGTGEMPPQLCYTLLSGTGQVGRGISKGFRVGAGVTVGCRYQINTHLRAQAEWQLPYWYHGGLNTDKSSTRGHYWQPVSTLGLQYDIDKKHALRIQANHDWQDDTDVNQEVRLSYRRHF